MKKLNPSEIYPLLKKRALEIKPNATDSELGRMSNISRSQIYYLKFGGKTYITKDIAKKVAIFLNIDIENIAYRDISFLKKAGRPFVKKSVVGKNMLSVVMLDFMWSVKNECG